MVSGILIGSKPPLKANFIEMRKCYGTVFGQQSFSLNIQFITVEEIIKRECYKPRFGQAATLII